MNGGERRLAILAGGGALPREIADRAAHQGVPVSIVAIEGEADADFADHAVTRVSWGQIGAMIRAMKQTRSTDLVIVGHVHRPEIWDMRPDLGFFRYLPQILKIVASGGDDGVLRRVVRFFEQQGLKVIGPGEAAPELVIGEGPLGAAASSPDDRADIEIGFALVRALGAYDIGQSVIVRQGRIAAIEGAEGTDRMIARAARAHREARDGASPKCGVLVKRSKPGQDLRVDLPAIGPATVDGARNAGLDGIALEAGRVLIAERAETLRRADAAGLFVEGVSDGSGATQARRYDPRKAAIELRPEGKSTPEAHATLDAVKGIATLDALVPFSVGRAVIVVRNHVLAVETGEGVEAAIVRAAGLRQWASITHARRGVASLAAASDLTPAVIEAVAVAGYAGIALAGPGQQVAAEMIGEADRHGLFVIRRATGEGTAT